MSKGRRDGAQVPLYSTLPQPIYTPQEHGQRHVDHRNSQHQRGIQTDQYRDPPFDYQKMMRYEPDMPRERYPWDHGQGPHGRDGRYGHAQLPGDYAQDQRDGGYVKIYHQGSQQRQDGPYHGYGGYDRGPGGHHPGYEHSYPGNHDPQGQYSDTHQFGTHHHGAGYDENKGYIVIARFVKSELATFVNAVQATVSILASYEGYVIGFAQPQDITMSLMSHADHANNTWLHGGQFAVCCFWFKHIRRAKEFFEGVNPFKQHEFPQFTKYDIIGVPLTYGRNEESLPLSPDSSPPTLMWAEFPSISERYPQDFLQNYADPMRQLVRKYGGHPHASICKVKAGWPAELNKFGQDGYRVLNVHSERVGRNIHAGWLKPDSFVTVSAFQTRNQLMDLLHDPEFSHLRNTLSNYTSPTIVGVTLHYVSGTRLNR